MRNHSKTVALYCADIPLKRLGTSAEVAAIVIHLLADESAYTTESEFVVDGRILAGAAASPKKLVRPRVNEKPEHMR